jgi:hypothetical protein
MSNKQKLNYQDFYYFSLPMRSPTANLKATRFCLWLALAQMIVLPVYFFSPEATVLPKTELLIFIYIFFSVVSLLSFITLLLFRTAFYEALVYLVAGLFFLELSFLFILIAYVEFFNSHNEMEIFNTLNLNIIESKKRVFLNQLFLVPIISTICGFLFHIYLIKTGKTNEEYMTINKHKKNNKHYELLFSVILIFALLLLNSFYFIGSTMNILFILGSIICVFFQSVSIIISYMKLKFPKVYLEKAQK